MVMVVDIPDPVEESEACLTICLRAQESLKNAQEQLNIAATQLENSVNPPTNNSTATISAPSVFTSHHNTAALEEILSAKYEAKREEQVRRYHFYFVYPLPFHTS